MIKRVIQILLILGICVLLLLPNAHASAVLPENGDTFESIEEILIERINLLINGEGTQIWEYHILIDRFYVVLYNDNTVTNLDTYAEVTVETFVEWNEYLYSNVWLMNGYTSEVYNAETNTTSIVTGNGTWMNTSDVYEATTTWAPETINLPYSTEYFPDLNPIFNARDELISDGENINEYVEDNYEQFNEPETVPWAGSTIDTQIDIYRMNYFGSWTGITEETDYTVDHQTYSEYISRLEYDSSTGLLLFGGQSEELFRYEAFNAAGLNTDTNITETYLDLYFLQTYSVVNADFVTPGEGLDDNNKGNNDEPSPDNILENLSATQMFLVSLIMMPAITKISKRKRMV